MSRADTHPDAENETELPEDARETFENLADWYDEDEPVGKIARAVLQSSNEETNS